jgi:dolichyl-phosphate beta-glucosyltransferase
MSTMPYLSVIVPAYNEGRIIAATLGSMRSFLDRQAFSYEIIVAADGNDGTRQQVADLARHDARLSVLGSAQRGGKGRGIKNAVARAKGHFIGFVDADNKTPIDELDKILPWLEDGYDFVFGSRGLSDSKVEHAQKWYRRIGSRGFKVAMHLIVGLWNVCDTQCGFKFFRGPVAHDLFQRLRVDGYMFDVDILFLASQTGYRMKEVGVRWRDDGDSRLALVAGNWQNFKDLFRIAFSAYPHPVAQPVPRAAPSSQAA